MACITPGPLVDMLLKAYHTSSKRLSINWDRPPTNETRASDPPSTRNKNSPLNSREYDEKSFWKNSKGKRHWSAKEKKSCGDLQRTKHSVNQARSKKHSHCHEFARVGLFSNSSLLLSSNKYSPFSFFFGPCFLRNFVQGVFSLTNGLNDAETQHNFQCKQMSCYSSLGY